MSENVIHLLAQQEQQRSSSLPSFTYVHYLLAQGQDEPDIPSTSVT
jgi:hypothetical protein